MNNMQEMGLVLLVCGLVGIATGFFIRVCARD